MLASTTVASYAAGGTRGNLTGTVVTQQGAPIAGVTVGLTAASGTFTDVTDAHGGFRFLGVPTDTYTVFLKKVGFEPRSLPGITLIGDGSVDLGKLTLAKALKTIAVVQSAAQNSSFHPTQTTDSYAITGQRIQQVLGNKYSTNEATLLQSSPGVIQSYDSLNGGGLSIRGSLAVELGYEYDGVPFSAPFFNENGSQGFVNGINGGTGGGIQIVPGAGDATQGDIGAGTINTVVPRGTFPGSGDIDAEAGGPYFSHSLNFDYGTATSNGKFSNYLSFSAQRYVPTVGLGPNGTNTAAFGAYFNNSYAAHNDFVDNAVFRFGKNDNQSFQVLGRLAFLQTYNGLGGLSNLSYFQSSPAFLGYNFGVPLSYPFMPNGTPDQQNAYLESLIPTLPYAPTANAPVLQPEITNANPLHFLKFGYTNNLNSTTFLSLAAYNWGLTEGGTNYTNFQNAGLFGTGTSVIGGSRTGFIGSITHQFGQYNTVTLEADYNNSKPYWDAQWPGPGLFILDLAAFGIVGDSGSPSATDWQLPASTNAPISATNPCPTAGGCYIYNSLYTAGKWTGVMPQVPNFGISYHNTDQQMWGVALRDQFAPTDRLHFDIGARIDGEQNKFGPTPYGFTTPSDVSPASLSNDFLQPRVFEPRLAVAYQMGHNDAIRFSYGRSTQFFFGQTLGTPFNVSGVSPLLAALPAKTGASCGSGYHGPGTGYVQNPAIPNAKNPNGGYYFQCPNYAASVAWLFDQNLDAPDLGGYGPPTYSNFDLGYTHLFSKGALRGWSTKITAYAERGFNVEQNVLLLNGPPNPITGQSSASVFTTTANGNEKKFGIEAQLTTPDVHRGQSGFSGFLTFDYINALTNTPPVAGSSNLPILAAQLLQTGQYFKAGYVPPVSAVLGFTYHFKSGITITPTIFANGGFPFGVGQTSIGYVNGQLMTLPETNYGAPNLPYAGVGGPGNAYNASYFVDPQVPGSYLNPNIAASRGYAEPA
ncbi:MAG: carboxypeptidase regulatory-like domain-containing protein, partial [Vulcanimicrobiaceae bacterium]